MKEIEITQIPGFKIGQAENEAAATGCTAIICENGAVCGVDVRGGSPGTRDTDALNPINNREKVHAVLLSGGSTFGLDAAGGVMKFLEQKRIGRDVEVTVVPNVCAAILFDLKCGSAKIRPDEQMGYTACENAFKHQIWQSGCKGAGTGAIVGNICGNDRAMKGGIGSMAFQHENLYVGAVVAVNCIGDIYDSRKNMMVAGARTVDGMSFANSEKVILEQFSQDTDIFSGNTVIGCIITNAKLNKPQATKLAALGQNGIARAVRPAHTIFDGDTIFTMCTGDVPATLDSIGILAAKSVEYAIVDAVRSATTFENYIALRDFMHEY